MEEELVDFYEDLQVSPRADQETIERVYRLLAKRYHPDNGCTGCVELFDRVTKAYRVLTDPEKRAAYDARYEGIRARRWRLAAAAAPGPDGARDRQIRHALLSLLYIERRNDPEKGSIGLWQMGQLLDLPEKAIEFHAWYLKEKGLIERTDAGGFAITASGVDAIEEAGGAEGRSLRLPEKTPSAGPAGKDRPEKGRSLPQTAAAEG
ncbi:MAG: J domain-containing protein [Desulfobacterales bacterium]